SGRCRSATRSFTTTTGSGGGAGGGSGAGPTAAHPPTSPATSASTERAIRMARFYGFGLEAVHAQASAPRSTPRSPRGSRGATTRRLRLADALRDTRPQRAVAVGAVDVAAPHQRVVLGVEHQLE